MPGTMRSRSAASAITVSTMPAAAIRWPIAHLNAVTGGAASPVPNTARSAAASDAVRLRRAVAVRDDHADVRRREPGFGQRLA